MPPHLRAPLYQKWFKAFARRRARLAAHARGADKSIIAPSVLSAVEDDVDLVPKILAAVPPSVGDWYAARWLVRLVRDSPSEALARAEKLSTPGARTEAVNRVLGLWAARDPHGLIDYYAGLRTNACASRGTTFANHRINSCVCTPSRSVLYTGQHIQQTRDVRQHELPVDHEHVDRDTARSAIMLRDAGYYTALQGQMAPDQGIRDGQRSSATLTQDLHARDGGATASPTTSAWATSSRTRSGGYLHDGMIARNGRRAGCAARDASCSGRQALVPRDATW